MSETLQTLLREALAIADEPVGETIRERESRIIAWKRAARAALSAPAGAARCSVCGGTGKISAPTTLETHGHAADAERAQWARVHPIVCPKCGGSPTTAPDTAMTSEPKAASAALTDAQIKHMVDRFLSWNLPAGFNPDGGILYKPLINAYTREPYPGPYGTNLFGAGEAEEMVRHMVEGMPATPSSPVPDASKAQTDETKAGELDGARPLPFDRETLGRMVREAWVRWAQTQPSPKPHWLLPYEELSEADKEADRQIGEAVARWTLVGDAARFAPTPSPDIAALRERAEKRLEEARNRLVFATGGSTITVSKKDLRADVQFYTDFVAALPSTGTVEGALAEALKKAEMIPFVSGRSATVKFAQQAHAIDLVNLLTDIRMAALSSPAPEVKL